LLDVGRLQLKPPRLKQTPIISFLKGFDFAMSFETAEVLETATHRSGDYKI
jgi:hypothetical protein